MIQRSTLIPVVESLSGGAVLCVGDSMLDRYVYGTVERVSPEAPIPILRVEREVNMLGGAGNVLRNLLALGARASIATVMGEDGAAENLRALFDACDGAMTSVTVAAGRKTTVKSRFLAGNQQLLRCDQESVEPLPTPTRLKILAAATEMMPDHAIILVSDYAKGVVSGRMARDLIGAAQQLNKRVIIDPKGDDYDRYRGADVITPNRRELEQAVGKSISRGEEADAAKQLAERFGFGAVIVTLGKDGMLLVTRDGAVTRMPTDAREVFDVSGAGDTVVATLAAAMAAGASIHQAAELANVAAGIVVGKVGTAVAYASEIVQELHRQDLSRFESKLMALEPAADRIDVWRRRGMKIGFTNGCFDLLHPGHVSLLTQARAACDRLVVGLNTDESVARLKGPSRPLQSESARATVLASLASVDIVVMFADDTPLELIKVLRPDVLVKGADYRIDQIVGADLVLEYGGQVLLADLEPGYSTSSTIERLTK
jgi:D-beta-D-heptose 7-phosphate kinase/D-beta-D-heptose 1-phosphate adenosyltransferase